MARLIISGVEGAEIPLEAGVTRIGRGEGNDVQINDSSISSCHCEIRFENGRLAIKDLDSTNGTYIEERQINKAVMSAGEKLRLGTVELLFEGDEPALPPFPVTREPVRVGVRAVPADSANECVNHPGSAAKWICQSCHSAWCPSCVKSQMVGMRQLLSCRACGGICVDLKKHLEQEARANATFGSLLVRAFSYPLKGNGWLMLILGTFFFALLDSVQKLYTLGLFVFVPTLMSVVLGGGYLFIFLKSIVTESAAGQDKMPGWPEVSSFSEAREAFLQCLCVWACCLGPAGVAFMFDNPVLAYALAVVGLLIVPMAFLAVSMTDSLSGLNPFVIIPAILRVPGAYLLACVVMLLVLGARRTGIYLAGLVHILFLPTLLSSFLTLYFLSVEMRILGVLYTKNKQKLGWF